MLKEQARLFQRLVIFMDVLILALSLIVAYIIRLQWDAPLGPFRNYVWLLLPALPLWYLLLSWNQVYTSMRKRSLLEIVHRLVNAHLLASIILAAFIYLIDLDSFSRGVFGAFVLISLGLLLLEKIALRTVLVYFRRHGFNYRNILVVGTCENNRRVCELLEETPTWGLRLVGHISVDDQESQSCEHCPEMGKIDDLLSVCIEHPIDEVIFSVPRSYLDEMLDHVAGLKEMGITVSMTLELDEIYDVRRDVNFLSNEIPLLNFGPKILDPATRLIKRLIDIVGGSVGLLLTGLMLPFIAAAIKLESPGPVFFGQVRVGQNGRIFKLWKFRSMTADAEVRKQELLERNEMNGAMFKMANDPRVTRVGAFLRKTSLDEFPQFWNVMKGEMSLVGTRPPTPDEVRQYENWQRRRISIKPGVTGLWQVSGRSTIVDFDDIVRLDLKYIDTWSFWLELKILFKTCWVVLRREGSC